MTFPTAATAADGDDDDDNNNNHGTAEEATSEEVEPQKFTDEAIVHLHQRPLADPSFHRRVRR